MCLCVYKSIVVVVRDTTAKHHHLSVVCVIQNLEITLRRRRLCLNSPVCAELVHMSARPGVKEAHVFSLMHLFPIRPPKDVHLGMYCLVIFSIRLELNT